MAFVAPLPFGRGHNLGRNWSGPLNAVLGGWQVQGIIQAQSGRPIAMGNLTYFGDPSKLRTDISSSTIKHAFNTSGFYNLALASNIRTFPTTLTDFRGQAMNNSDLSILKLMALGKEGRFGLQIRGEFLNAFNHPFFSNPSVDPTNAAFGTITSQYNLPREVQLGMRLTY